MSSTNMDGIFEGSGRRAAAWPLALGAFALYVVFAAIVFWAHGSEPPLNIDHVSYFKLADEIRMQFPNGDYWRSWNSVRAYGVILAYIYPLTGSHILSLKVLLAVMTVAYLASFHLFMTLAGARSWHAVLFALMSAMYVSLGGSIWGMTEFTASLNRTLIVPFIVIVIWFFFRKPDSLWRYFAFPALVVLSLLHLGALHVFLALCVYEGLDFLRRRLRFDRQLGAFVAALGVSILLNVGIEALGVGATGYVRWNLAKAIGETPPASKPPAVVASKEGPPVVAGVPSAAPAPPPAAAVSSTAPTASPPAPVAKPGPPPVFKMPAAPEKLSPTEAWAIELFAFPWRNMPPSLPTVATIALSFGVILALALWGAFLCFRRGTPASLDRRMALFAAAVLITSYGLQLALWGLRQFTPIYPVNFEEIRALNLIMFPAMHFVFRLYERAPTLGALRGDAMRAVIVGAFLLQPIYVLRALPADWREGIIRQAVSMGFISPGDSLRVQYANQILGLHRGPRYYYSARPAIAWLERNAAPKDKVMTNLNDFYSSKVEAVGVFLNIVNLDARSPDRFNWMAALQAVDGAFASKDMPRILAVAKGLGATFVVVPWEVPGAVYRDDYYSIVRVA
jgi:hypothetical protein